MASDSKLAFHSSTIAMMHGPINIRLPEVALCFVACLFVCGCRRHSSFYWPRQKKHAQTNKQPCGFRTAFQLRKSSSFRGPCRRKLTVLEQQYFVNSSTYQLVVCSSSFSFAFTFTVQSLETFALIAYGRLLWCYLFIKSLLTAVTCNLCT